MPVDYQCITLPVHGRFNGRVLRVLPKTLAPGGSNWLPNACAMECAASAECGYWLVRPPPDNKCVIKAKKGSRFVADAAYVHGDVDQNCARPVCTTSTATSSLACIPDDHPCGFLPEERSYNATVLLAVPAGVSVSCGYQCANTLRCSYWRVSMNECLLLSSETPLNKTRELTSVHGLYDWQCAKPRCSAATGNTRAETPLPVGNAHDDNTGDDNEEPLLKCRHHVHPSSTSR